jgi:hypothetical protein
MRFFVHEKGELLMSEFPSINAEEKVVKQREARLENVFWHADVFCAVLQC